jgi:hypothetical protein
VATLLVEVAPAHEIRARDHARFLERALVAALTLARDVDVGGAGDEADSFPADVHEVGDRRVRALLVRHRDEVHVQTDRRAVDGDHGHTGSAQTAVGVRLAVARDEQDPRHALAAQGVEIEPLPPRLAVGVAEEQRVVLELEGVFDAADDSGEEGVEDVRDHDPDRASGAYPKVAGHPVGKVVELAGGPDDPASEGVTNLGRARDHPGNRRGGDARPGGDLADRRRTGTRSRSGLTTGPAPGSRAHDTRQ